MYLKYPNHFTREVFDGLKKKNEIVRAWGQKDLTHARNCFIMTYNGITIKKIRKLNEIGLSVKFGGFKNKIEWNQLPAYLEQNHISQSYLARECDVDTAYMCRLLKDIESKNPNCDFVNKVSRVLRVTILFEKNNA
jgi:transcriptional regulator with XRE-family HTH domain